MEPIEEYLRNLHRKSEPKKQAESDSRPESMRPEPSPAPEPTPTRESSLLADAPTTDLPAIRNRSGLDRLKGASKRRTPAEPTEPKWWARKDLLIGGVGAVVIVAAVMALIIWLPGRTGEVQGDETHTASGQITPTPEPSSATQGSENDKGETTSAKEKEDPADALVRLSNERAQAYTTADKALLTSLTVEGSPARKAEDPGELADYAGMDVAIDVTNIEVADQTESRATVNATMTVRMPGAEVPNTQDVTVQLRDVEGAWRVWEVTSGRV